MLRLLILGASIFLIYKLFFSGGKKEKKKDGFYESEKNMGDMVKDPVCGTYVSVKSDIRVKDKNRVYFFCSYDCRDKFLKKLKNENTAENEKSRSS